MNGVTCLTLNQQLDGFWVWTAYDKSGRRLLVQDRCDDLAHAVECAITAIAARKPTPDETEAAPPGPEATRKPKRHNARK